MTVATKFKKALDQIGSENLFGTLAMASLLVAVACLAGVYWSVLLLGLLLFYLAWVAHGEQADSGRIEEQQKSATETAVHEALHAAKLDKEGLVSAIEAVTAKAIDEIRTEARRAELRPVS